MDKSISLGGFPVLNAGVAYREALAKLTPQDFWGRANSYRCPRGKEPGKAWLLMARGHLNQLHKNAFHTLRWSDGDTELVVSSLTIVRAICLDKSATDDDRAKYLVEFEDTRRVLPVASIDDQYNVRIPAPSTTSGAGLYYTDSLNGGVVWTWQTLLDDVWANLPGIAGTGPTLPYSPHGTPEGWRFLGVKPWDAVHELLQKVGCDTAYNPITDGFTYVRLGQTQTVSGRTISQALERLANRLIYNYDPLGDLHQAHMPQVIRVHFNRTEEYYGIEKDSPNAVNWEMNPTTSKDYSTGLTGAFGTLPVWDDLPALYDSTGSITNDAELQARADEVGENIRNRLDVTDERLRQIISGIHVAILPGSEISEVVWRDYGDTTGLVTEFIREPVLKVMHDVIRERVMTPDLARSTHPLYPRVSQMVQADDGSSPVGSKIAPNGAGLFPGFVIRWAAGAWSTLEACWIRPADLEHDPPAEASVIDLLQKDRYVGRLAGVETSGGSTRPVYIVRAGGIGTLELHFLTADETIAGPVTLEHFDTLDFDASDKLWSVEANGTQADRGIVTQVEVDGGDATIKHVRIAIDKTVLTQVELQGSATSANTVNVEDGTRNSIAFDASATSPIVLTKNVDDIQITANNPFHSIETDHATLNQEDLDYDDTLEFTTDGSDKPEVTKAGTKVTVKLPEGGSELPIGAIIMGYKAPILDTGKYYLDDGGAADTDWALMDGISNVSPGSGIEMWNRNASPDTSYYPRGRDALTAADNTAYGRTISGSARSDNNDDEVGFSVDDHDDHSHQVTGDLCDTVDGTAEDAWYFAGTDAQTCTSGVKDFTDCTIAAGAGVLSHGMSLTNAQASASGGVDYVELTPPTKCLHFFEKVA